MIDSLVNLLFRCSHKRLTRPVTPVSRDGKPHGDTYVVCLDCGKQFRYDLQEMRIGKPLPGASDHGVLPPAAPASRRSKRGLAVMASAVPLGFIIGAVLSSKRRGKLPQPQAKDSSKPDPEKPPSS